MDNDAKPCRESYWSEIDAEQKIERMRGEVLRLQAEVELLRHGLTQLFSHMHAEGGLAYKDPCPIDAASAIGRAVRRASQGENVYF